MLNQDTKEQMLSRLERHVAENPLGLYPHQIEAIEAIISFLRQDKSPDGVEFPEKLYDGGSVRMATGSGKTHIEWNVAKGMDVPGILITPRVFLNTQAKEAYIKKLGLDPKEVAIFDSARDAEERAYAVKGAKHIITTPESFVKLHEVGALSPDPENPNYRPLLQLDESDLMVAEVRSDVIRQYVPNCITLAYSATDYGVNQALFGGQTRRIHDLPLTEAVRRGIVSKGIKTAVVDVEANDLYIKKYIKKYQDEYPEDMLEAFAKNRNIINAAIYFHATHVDDELGPINRLPTLITVQTIDAAKEVAKAFNQKMGKGYAVAVSGETPTEDVIDPETKKVKTKGLKTLLEEFNQNTSQTSRVLIYPKVIGRGTDIPNATVTISMKPLKRPNTVEQDLGRITRRADEEYFEQYGHDKIALAVNIRTPEIQPYLYSQVIGGPAIYEPKAAIRKYQSHVRHEKKPLDLPYVDTMHVTTDVQRLTAIYEDAEAASRERSKLIPGGWLSVEDAAQKAGIPLEEARRRSINIKAGERYTILGLKADTRGAAKFPIVNSSELKMGFGGRTILNEAMVEEWRRIQAAKEKMLAEGAESESAIAGRYNMSKHQIRAMRQGGSSELVGEAGQLPEGIEEAVSKKKAGRPKAERD